MDAERGGKECQLFLVMGAWILGKRRGLLFSSGSFIAKYDGGWYGSEYWRVTLLQLIGGSGNI